MTEPEALVPDAWRSEPAPCHNCAHSWHSVPCVHCTCETSTETQRLIIPRLAMPRTWHGDQA